MIKSQTRLYKLWTAMKSRCYSSNRLDFKHYGGRGITVCNEWLDFETFARDMGDPPSDLHSLDRIDSNGNYELSNCRWATQSEQIANRRPHRVVHKKARHIYPQGKGFAVKVTISHGDRFNAYRRNLSDAEMLRDTLLFERDFLYNLGYR